MENKPLKVKISFSFIRKVFVSVFALAIAFGAGYGLGFKGLLTNLLGYPEVKIDRTLPADKKELNFSLFWRTWDTLNAKYYDKEKLIPAKMVYGAISGMVSSIGDPYTVFLPPSENKVIQEDLKGSFEGVGIQLGFKGTQLAVIAPLPGSPAEKAGVMAGDLIVGIKDEGKGVDIKNTQNMNLETAVETIRGDKGTTVTLTLVREGVDEPLSVDIVRDTLDVPSVALTYVGENKDIAHLSVYRFAAETQGEWDNAVTEILKNGQPKGIILDLRNNPGGYLQGAVDLATDFLDSGTVVVIEEDANKSRIEYKVEKLGRLKKTKLVVLINKGSASASEILAGALRDQKKVQLIGDTSFGKGTIQEPEELDDGSGLHITIARWLTPNGTWVNEKGLEPDVKVKDDPATSADEQLDAAIKVINGE
jgi:carboxyl-terminal processing protease